jgi:hypothetical protein
MKASSCVCMASTVLLLMFTAPAAAQEKTPEEKAFLERVNRPVVYRVEGMDRVRMRKDLVYKREGPLELKMDISTPEKPSRGERLPVVFLIHGGISADTPLLPKD